MKVLFYQRLASADGIPSALDPALRAFVAGAPQFDAITAVVPERD